MKFIAAALLSALMSVGHVAHAASESEANDTPGTAQDLGPYAPGASFTVTGSRTGGDVDFFSFSLTAAGQVSLAVVTTSGFVGADPILGLWTSGGAAPLQVEDTGGANLDNGDDPFIASMYLDAGSYLIGVTHFSGDALATGQVGDFSSSDPNAWNYNLQVQTTPVPEPETFALFLAGLGTLALMRRRRSS